MQNKIIPYLLLKHTTRLIVLQSNGDKENGDKDFSSVVRHYLLFFFWVKPKVSSLLTSLLPNSLAIAFKIVESAF